MFGRRWFLKSAAMAAAAAAAVPISNFGEGSGTAATHKPTPAAAPPVAPAAPVEPEAVGYPMMWSTASYSPISSASRFDGFGWRPGVMTYTVPDYRAIKVVGNAPIQIGNTTLLPGDMGKFVHQDGEWKLL